MFRRVLIANRGVIACRIIRTLKRMGITAIAIYSDADRQSLHVLEADEAVPIGAAPTAVSYLDADAVLEAARVARADALHPGYGFLSENAAFARACEAVRIAFIGPRPEQIDAFGRKHRARELAAAQRVPLLPGSGLLADVADAQRAAAAVGYPVMLKSSAGGGGLGLRLVRDAAALPAAFESMQRLATVSFGDAGLYLERYIERARHIEVQVLGDGRGRVIALGERDCSLQRRHQKVIEETPAVGLDPAVRKRLHDAAVRLVQGVRYRSAGTVEFLIDAATGQFYFLEMSTRLPVEHGVTEEVFGIDLVELMVRIAAGETQVLDRARTAPRGVAIEVRLYAEDPARGFLPSVGTLTDVRFPAGARVDTWIERGAEVTPWYDPMLAQLIVRGESRDDALRRLRHVLQLTRIAGVETNLAWLRSIATIPAFIAGSHTTRLLDELAWQMPPAIDVLESGVQSSVQDWPGRIGYWDVGVPPSGPMDEYAFRVANRLVGNERGGGGSTAGLECTMTGPLLRFNADAVIAVTGAPANLQLDGEPLEMWTSHAIAAGSELRIGRIAGPGCRAYLAVAGGIDVPPYLGSRSTFMLGRFGGNAGRSLRAGDVLPLAAAALSATLLSGAEPPLYRNDWKVGVLIGPHASPDFFTAADIDTLFSATWTLHYNSSRTGLRLVGPKPQWARTDGGDAGLHPANVHDHASAIGAITFNGDTPVIVGPDGPSLGGAVSPAVVVQAELWKLGQMRPGDRVELTPLTIEGAAELARRLERSIDTLTPPPSLDDLPPAAVAGHQPSAPAVARPSPVLGSRLGDPIAGDDHRVAVTFRQSGDAYLLVEYGAPVLDIGLRLRVHALLEALRATPLPGLIDLTPGIRSLQIHFDPQRLPRARLLRALERLDEQLPSLATLEIPSRIVHLPLAWDDAQTRLAIDKYRQAVRADAPWCPSNLEFIRRINGLPSTDALRSLVFDASYVVLGLGDVYLGAPVMTPLDPRHRLLATKYNPPRTWTPENAVGIGGAYLYVNGMEGPGGHQLVGRTLQMWNRYRTTRDFEHNRPWLLRFFDQIRFYPVSDAELTSIREDFPTGRYSLRVEAGTFNLRRYRDFLARESASINAFQQRQQAAFAAERERWRASGDALEAEEERQLSSRGMRQLPEGTRPITSTVPGSVCKVLKRPGELVAAQETVLIVASMKMEFPVASPCAGRVLGLLCREGGAVTVGQEVMLIEPS